MGTADRGDALKRGAGTVMPFYPYARQDKNTAPRTSRAVIADLLSKIAGADRIVTVTYRPDPGFLHGPVDRFLLTDFYQKTTTDGNKFGVSRPGTHRRSGPRIRWCSTAPSSTRPVIRGYPARWCPTASSATLCP